MLAVDASVVVLACLSQAGFEPLAGEQLIAPPLLWSEVMSVVHEMRWRRAISNELADIALERLRTAPISWRQPASLHDHAWRISDELGWARTYDAEYVAMATLGRCSLLTADARLRRGAGRLVNVIEPADL